MSTINYFVYRWPFTVSESNRELETNEGSGASANVASGDWIAEGDGSPDDLIAKFNTAVAAVYSGSGLTLPAPVAALNENGTVTITGGFVAMDLDQTIPANPFPLRALGFDDLILFIPASPGTVTGDFQAINQWHPGIDRNFRSYRVKKYNRFSRRNLQGRPYFLVHGERNDVEIHSYDLVKGAVMFDGMAAAADYASVAGVAVGEPNTLENMLEYAWDTGSNELYWYDSNDPSSAVRQGPVVLDPDDDVLQGLDPDSFVASMSSSHYPVTLKLWSV